jgi:hypothetical protein
MKLAFHHDNLSFRGTTTAIFDYAYYNQKILNNDSIICYNKSILTVGNDENFSKKTDIVNLFKSNFDVIEYESKLELISELDKRNCDTVYTLKAGFNDGNIVECKRNLIHATFNFYQPHGDVYAYVSHWLSETASGGSCPVVPHIVDLKQTGFINIKPQLGISQEKIILGRYGGFDQFDIPMVYEIINFIVSFDPTIVFLFVNTRKFIDHPNVKFLDPILTKQEKINFILSCDAMIHARSDGESFGLSICEFLALNKPVISFGGGRDKNNVNLLSKYGMIYNNQYELLECIMKVKHKQFNNVDQIVVPFSPDRVMQQFNDVFLQRL